MAWSEQGVCRLVVVVILGAASVLAACDTKIELPVSDGTVDRDGDGIPDPPGPPQPFTPAEARLRRLLGFQLKNAVGDLLGAEAAAAVTPPADVPVNGFVSVGAASLSLTPIDVEKVEASAFAAAQLGVHGDAPQSWRGCAPASFDDAGCLEQQVRAFGRRAFRRPMTDEEAARWTAVGTTAATAYGDFDMGVEFAVAGMLQSPFFLYQVEIGVDDGAGKRRLTGYEIASRLSFFLVGSTPSDALLDAAEAGELDDPIGVRLHAEQLLGDSARAAPALRAFWAEKLGLDQLPAVERAEQSFTASMRAAMQEEALRTFDDVVFERNADARELFVADFTYVNDELAGFYGLPLPGSGPQLVRVALDPSTGRGGLLTQGAFLARFAHERRSSPTLRGKFIREGLLCAAVPAPPNNVNTTIPETSEDGLPHTTRDRMEQHMTEPGCAACHALMDPLGFALEGFDEVGRARTHENGLPVNTQTEVNGTPVADARELEAYVRDSVDGPRCLVRNLFRFGVGHIEGRGEDPSLDLVDVAFEDSGYRLQDALLAIATSDAFRYVAPPQDAANDGGAP